LANDLRLVRQECDWASVRFDDAAVADYFDEQVEAGRRPEQFGRIWIHTHPGNSPTPSGTDEATFERVFGGCDWAVMLILACGGQSYARLKFKAGPGLAIVASVDVDLDSEYPATDRAAWEQEYQACVTRAPEPSIEFEDLTAFRLDPSERDAWGGNRWPEDLF
jgi:hypothetical protein